MSMIDQINDKKDGKIYNGIPNNYNSININMPDMTTASHIKDKNVNSVSYQCYQTVRSSFSQHSDHTLNDCISPSTKNGKNMKIKIEHGDQERKKSMLKNIASYSIKDWEGFSLSSVLFFCIIFIVIVSFLLLSNTFTPRTSSGIIPEMKGSSIGMSQTLSKKENNEDDKVDFDTKTVISNYYGFQENEIPSQTKQTIKSSIKKSDSEAYEQNKYPSSSYTATIPPFSTLTPFNKTRDIYTTSMKTTITIPNTKIRMPSLYPYLRPHQSQPNFDIFGAKHTGTSYEDESYKTMKNIDSFQSKKPFPTNAWYQNIVLGMNKNQKPTQHQCVYTIPYVHDFSGPIPGVRTSYPYAVVGDTIIQWTYQSTHGLTLGKMMMLDDDNDNDNDNGNNVIPNRLWSYKLMDFDDDSKTASFSSLGFHLVWKQFSEKDFMTAPIIRGMPYTTMLYEGHSLPVIASDIPIGSPPIVDSISMLSCNGNKPNNENKTKNNMIVNEEVELYFKESDFTWLVFYSRPVTISCSVGADVSSSAAFELHVLPEKNDDENDELLVVRIALLNNCTKGTNPSFCQTEKTNEDANIYGEVLRNHARSYPYNPQYQHLNTSGLDFEHNTYTLPFQFDWGSRIMHSNNSYDTPLIMFALPHHFHIIQSDQKNKKYQRICSPTFHGNACLVSSDVWTMQEKLAPLNFLAPRPPRANFIAAMAKSLEKDMQYQLPQYYMQGAGDTYFSGKMLAKLGRILMVADELKHLQRTNDIYQLKNSYRQIEPNHVNETLFACKQVHLPSDHQFEITLDRLRKGVEIWINGTAETKFVYDISWGGIVSCGCLFSTEKQGCLNKFPDCPTFHDPGLDFGNGFYNDHHFHYGYHIYAAAILSYFDAEWGKAHFEEVLLLIRDIANPSLEDKYFPIFRHKDLYIGNSWASGISTIGGQPFLNGRNQESSSEAIAAYEGISLYGYIMNKHWNNHEISDAISKNNAKVSAHIREIGRLLTATELRAADNYYHVRHDANSPSVYPTEYKPSVVGIMWSMMSQFQTWFGNSPFLVYGIQLLPLTPISEVRDNVQWVKQFYHDFAESCEENDVCFNQGWAILQYALLAEVGHQTRAMKKVLTLPEDVFTSSGGSGHSLSNTLWYLSTRPDTVPLDLQPTSAPTILKPAIVAKSKPSFSNCGCPKTCTESVLQRDADNYTCRARITWLIQTFGLQENVACSRVGGEEFREICGGCDPDRCEQENNLDENSSPLNQTDPREYRGQHKYGNCKSCSAEVCRGDLNRCPVFTAPYLCELGPNVGGCASSPWEINNRICFRCCKLTPHCSNM